LKRRCSRPVETSTILGLVASGVALLLFFGPKSKSQDAVVGAKARRAKELPPEKGLVRGDYEWTTPEAKQFSRDLATAADATHQLALAQRGHFLPVPPVDPKFMASTRGQKALRFLGEHRIDLDSPWNHHFWNLRQKVERDRIAGWQLDAHEQLVGAARKKRTDEDVARHWEKLAAEYEDLAAKPKAKDRREMLEMAAEYRAKAARTRAGKGMYSED